MTEGPIAPLSCARVVDRRDHRLATAWIHLAAPTGPRSAGRWLAQEEALRHADDRGPVLVMLGSASSPALAALEAHGGAGARTYVLAPSHWSSTSPALLRCPRVLVRRVAEVPASAFHAPGGAEVWMGATPGGPAPWRLRLDDEQAAALRQLFLRMFWHDALDEAWTGGERLVFRKAVARPFDVPELAPHAVVRVVEPRASLDAAGAEQRVLRNQGEPPSRAIRRLWLPPGGADHAAIARRVREGATVGWDERGLPDLATDGRSGSVLLPGHRGRLHIELSPAQGAEAARLLDAPTPWCFRLDVRLGDHLSDSAKVWLDGAAEPRPVVEEQPMALPDLTAAELRGMDEAAPSQWPEPHPLSSTVCYRWTVQPPRIPASAKEDPLIVRWRKLDGEWSSRLRAVGDGLVVAKEARGRLGSFARLVGAVMGFQRKHGELAAEVEALAGRRPSEAGPEDAVALLHRLAHLEDQANRLRADQDEEERKALEHEERERQENEWRARVAKAGRDVPDKRSEVETLEARAVELADELARIAEARTSAEKDKDKKARKDLDARRKKLEDEAARCGRRLQGRREELEALQRAAAQEFAFVPPERPKPPTKPTTGRFVPTETGEPPKHVVPEQALPEVGVLRSHEGKRYLVIDTWSQLELGERAARRLGARLVAPEEA